MIAKALKIPNRDLEDNLQYLTAKECNCELIITNDKSFYTNNIDILSSLDFVRKYIN